MIENGKRLQKKLDATLHSERLAKPMILLCLTLLMLWFVRDADTANQDIESQAKYLDAQEKNVGLKTQFTN